MYNFVCGSNVTTESNTFLHHISGQVPCTSPGLISKWVRNMWHHQKNGWYYPFSAGVLLWGVLVYSDCLLSHQIRWVIRYHTLWRWPIRKVIIIYPFIFDLHMDFGTFIEWIPNYVLLMSVGWYRFHPWKYIIFTYFTFLVKIVIVRCL